MSEVSTMSTITFTASHDASSLEQTYLTENELGINADDDDSSKHYNFIQLMQNESIVQVSSADFIEQTSSSKAGLENSNDAILSISPYWKKSKESNPEEVFKDEIITQVTEANKQNSTAKLTAVNPLLTSNIKIEASQKSEEASKVVPQPVYLLTHIDNHDLLNSLTSWTEQLNNKNTFQINQPSTTIDIKGHY